MDTFRNSSGKMFQLTSIQLNVLSFTIQVLSSLYDTFQKDLIKPQDLQKPLLPAGLRICDFLFFFYEQMLIVNTAS